MLNIDEVKYYILMSQCCNFYGNGLMFTISYMAGRFQTHNVKKEKEEGPCGRGRTEEEPEVEVITKT